MLPQCDKNIICISVILRAVLFLGICLGSEHRRSTTCPEFKGKRDLLVLFLISYKEEGRILY